MMGYITVDVTKVPGAMKTITLDEARTVADALEVAGITLDSGYEVRVDGEAVSTDYTLEDGATVVVTKMIKGN